MAKEVKKSSEAIIAELDKKYGKGSVIDMNESSITQVLDVISTGSIYLDKATGIGGIPRGRIVEMYGPESSGKTTIATHVMGNAQKLGKVGFLDVEHTFDFQYAQKIGLKKQGLTFAQPDHGEMAFDIMKELLKTGEYSCIVLDSVASAIPKEQHEGETNHSRMSRLAAMMSLEIPKIVPLASSSNCSIIFLNQLRNNIGGYGNPLKPAGGDSLKFYCSMRFDITKQVQKDDQQNKTTVKVVKNKCAIPFGVAEFFIEWGIGIDQVQEIIDCAIEMELIKAGGAGWMTIGDTKIQGVDKMKQFFIDNPEFYNDLRSKIIT